MDDAGPKERRFPNYAGSGQRAGRLGKRPSLLPRASSRTATRKVRSAGGRVEAVT